VLVIEADDRVGGRTENHPLGGGKISELMGEYVGPTQDQVVRLGRELGIGTFKTYNKGGNVLFFARPIRTDAMHSINSGP